MKEVSPVYRAAEVDASILLAHGTDDAIIDVDHTHRMANMLEAYGKPVEVCT